MHHISLPPDRGFHLRVDGVSFSYADRRVLTDVSFVVAGGDRAGVIGENGSGKSTLLRVIAGILTPSAGRVSVNAAVGTHSAIGLLHQQPPFDPGDRITEALEVAVAPARRAVDAVTRLAGAVADHPQDPEIERAYADALDAADHLEAWEVDTRIDATIGGLGLGGLDRTRPTGSLSGGQRARLALACLLLNRPDVLLLDEPTNHLDDAATAYLVSVLGGWRGPVLMASHDRAFLDDAATSLIDLDPAPAPHAATGELIHDGPGSGIGVTRFTGTYSAYLTERAETMARWERRYRDEQAELSRLRASVKDQQRVGHRDWKPRTEVRIAQKFYADRNARVVSRRVNDARTRLDTLEQRQVRKPPAVLEFRGLTAAGDSVHDSPGPVLTATGVGVAGRLAGVSMSISGGEKWLITGPNGSGKSTLLNILAGAVTPTMGAVVRAPGKRFGLLTQDTDLPDPHHRGPERTAAQTYIDIIGPRLAAQVPLSTFGLLAPRDQNRPVAELSVGQQRRLALAAIVADPPEILLLDEPTNHFALSLVTALENAIKTYPGAVVIASHDRWLRTNWTGRHLALPVSAT